MGWRGTPGGTRAMAFAERRLVAVARQWRVPPEPEAPGDALTAHDPPAARQWDAIAAPGDPPDRDHGQRWSRSAVRGLVVLVALAVTVAGYWAWSGRPRAVAVAPSVLAVGTPLPGAPGEVAATAPAGPASPAAVPQTDSPVPQIDSPAPQLDPIPLVVVHVTGLVARPGLVRLPAGSRVADAVAEAGGVTRRRAADTVNLARVLIDGEQVVVGSPGTAGTSSAAGATAAPVSGPVVVDLNVADVPALDSLPGIGPVLAGRIVAWRTTNGAFRSVDELGEVSGIGDAVLAQVRDLVRV